jgi:hypothetical protein
LNELNGLRRIKSKFFEKLIEQITSNKKNFKRIRRIITNKTNYNDETNYTELKELQQIGGGLNELNSTFLFNCQKWTKKAALFSNSLLTNLNDLK